MNESISKEFPAPAGSTVKVGGIPYELKGDAVLIGCMEPDWSWSEPTGDGKVHSSDDGDATASAG